MRELNYKVYDFHTKETRFAKGGNTIPKGELPKYDGKKIIVHFLADGLGRNRWGVVDMSKRNIFLDGFVPFGDIESYEENGFIFIEIKSLDENGEIIFHDPQTFEEALKELEGLMVK